METTKQEIFKWLRFISFFIVFSTLPIIIWFLKEEVDLVAIVVAFEIGVAAIINEQLNRIFFRPSLSFKINKVYTKTKLGEPQIWYHLCLENCGFSSAKNVRVKIRDDNDRGWVNLVLPYGKTLEDEHRDLICIKNISVGEDCQFDIGFIGKDNNFGLNLDIYPFNQKNLIPTGERQIYFLEIVSDNAPPEHFKIQIDNKGYGHLDINIV